MNIQTETTCTIQLSSEEFKLFYHGLGMVSQNSLVKAGMSTEESSFFCKIFHTLHALPEERK